MLYPLICVSADLVRVLDKGRTKKYNGYTLDITCREGTSYAFKDAKLEEDWDHHQANLYP